MNLLSISVVCILIFWHHGMWDLSSRPRMEPASPAFEGRVLTSGPPGKPLHYFFFFFFLSQVCIFPLLQFYVFIGILQDEPHKALTTKSLEKVCSFKSILPVENVHKLLLRILGQPTILFVVVVVKLIYNWRIIVLQCCIDFCHTST